jgi:hypothetical protein
MTVDASAPPPQLPPPPPPSPPPQPAQPAQPQQWEQLCGSFVLRPPPSEPPRAVLHFLGGAFVGAAPHVTYPRLLSLLAESGFVVVATPYELDFDYLKLCDQVLDSFDNAHAALRTEYGALPVVGVGHSCGALLHVLLCSLFVDESQRASPPPVANVLISFNNKRASNAIPLFGSIVSPAASSLLQLEHAPLLAPWLQALASARERLDEVAAPAGSAAPLTRDLAALASQLLPMLDQILPVLRQIDAGQTEFEPAPDHTHSAASQLYRAARTLVLRFDDDGLDESLLLPPLLQRGGDVQLHSLRGTHLTPLAPALPAMPIGGAEEREQLDAAARTLDAVTAAAMREFTDAAELVAAFLCESVPAPAGPSASEEAASEEEEAPRTAIG